MQTAKGNREQRVIVNPIAIYMHLTWQGIPETDTVNAQRSGNVRSEVITGWSIRAGKTNKFYVYMLFYFISSADDCYFRMGWDGLANRTSSPPHCPPSKLEVCLGKIFQATKLFSPQRFASLCFFPLSLKWHCIKRDALVGRRTCVNGIGQKMMVSPAELLQDASPGSVGFESSVKS